MLGVGWSASAVKKKLVGHGEGQKRPGLTVGQSRKGIGGHREPLSRQGLIASRASPWPVCVRWGLYKVLAWHSLLWMESYGSKQ